MVVKRRLWLIISLPLKHMVLENLLPLSGLQFPHLQKERIGLNNIQDASLLYVSIREI